MDAALEYSAAEYLSPRCDKKKTLKNGNQAQALSVLVGAVFATMLGNGMVMPFIPVYVTEFGLGGFAAGFLFSVHAFVRTVLLPVIGKASDKWGRKGFLLLGILLYAAASLAYPFATKISDFVGIMAVHGTGMAIVHLVSVAYVGDLAPRGQEGRYSGYINTALLGGIAVGPVLGGIVRDLASMSANFFVMTVMSFISFLMLSVFLPVAAKNTGRADGDDEAGKGIAPLRRLLDCRPVLGVACFRLAYAFTNALVWIFLPILTLERWTLSTTQIGLLISVNVAVSTLLQAPCGRLADRTNKAVMILVGGLGGAIGLAIFPLATAFWELLALNIFIGACYGLAFPAHTAIGMENAGRLGMATVMSMLMMSHSLGMTVGPLMFGAIADRTNLPSVFYLGGILNICLLWACWRALSPTRDPVVRDST